MAPKANTNSLQEEKRDLCSSLQACLIDMLCCLRSSSILEVLEEICSNRKAERAAKYRTYYFIDLLFGSVRLVSSSKVLLFGEELCSDRATGRRRRRAVERTVGGYELS